MISLKSIDGVNLKSLYESTRQLTLEIVRPLEVEDCVVQPALFVSPPKWHLAHTSWFFEQFVLQQFFPGYEAFDSDFKMLFNSYYFSVGDRPPRDCRGFMTRPTLQAIMDYRLYVDEEMKKFLLEPSSEAIEVIKIGIQHEQQHQELLLTDIKYILAQNPLFPVYRKDFNEGMESEPIADFLEVEGGQYHIGAKNELFSFDNEKPHHHVMLNDFRISQKLVTNGEYLEFMEEGGYKRPEWWHSDGWEFIRKNKIEAPLYWHQKDVQWYRFSLSGLHSLNQYEPITHINHYEAFAYAQWKNKRLPTEQEWEVAASKLKIGLRWEHTSSAYLPYPGYKKPNGAIGEYNGKFMINQMVLRGYSIATPKGHSRISYRNFFYPEMRWQFNGIRLAD